MQLVDITLCVSDWDFRPCSEWPEILPAISWKSHLLCGFHRERGQALALEGELTEALKACYSDLSFAELTRFWSLVKEEEFNSWPELFQAYGYRFDLNCEKTMKALLQTPEEFQFWASHKKLGMKDLAILRCLQEDTSIKDLCLYIARQNASKNTGQQALEIAIELLLCDETLPSFDESIELWHKTLYKMRYTETSSKDSDDEEKMLKLPWPSKSKTRWLRQGDRSGVQFQFYISNHQEFEKQVKGLEKVYQLVKENPKLLWKN